jgi:hypothetical protein
MMRRSLLVATVLAAVAPVPAWAEISTQSCEDAGLVLNSVTAMRPFANGGIKLFAIDREEPAAMPAGVAVTIDRGDNLDNAESFCRYVSGLSSVDIAAADASYNDKKALLTVKIPVRLHNADADSFSNGTLTLVIDKAAKKPGGLVKATAK